jgi:hypothetical protein
LFLDRGCGTGVVRTFFESWIGVFGRWFLGVPFGDLILEGAGHGEGRGKTDAT